jgi:hypothetical protein
MPLPLGKLDDRRWDDLVEEGRALVPLLTRAEPRWTDHNIHDPGITLVELFAWLTEMNIYQLSRIPERHRRKFLALIGFLPRGPRAARTVLSFQLKPGKEPITLPAGMEFETTPLPGLDPRVRTLRELTIVPVTIGSILVDDGTGLRDRTRILKEGRPLSVFGEDPRPDPDTARPALYLGLREIKPGHPLTFYLRFAGPGTDEEERERILQNMRQVQEACRRPKPGPCEKSMPQSEECVEAEPSAPDLEPDTSHEDEPLVHHSARVVWEIFASSSDQEPDEGRWVAAGEVEDNTRSLTLDGIVRITLPPDLHPKKSRQGPLREMLFYLRCRFDSGQYDAPPRLLNLLPNSVVAEQAVPVGQWKLTIPAGLLPEGRSPQAGETTRVRLHLNKNGTLTKLAFQPDAPDMPDVTVLEYTAPVSDKAGTLVLELNSLGLGEEGPHEVFSLSETKVQEGSFQLFTLEQKEENSEERIWRSWTVRDNLDSSTRTDLHILLNSDTGEITSGSGERGRLFPRGAIVLATYRATLAGGGNLAPGKITTLSKTLHNVALLGKELDELQDSLELITNPLGATGGVETETVDHATGRAMENLWAHERLLDLCERFACQSLDQIPRDEILSVQAPQRAVSLLDLERLALDVAGTQVARVRAWANLHPTYPCLQAPGVVTVVIMPFLPARRPQPSQGQLHSVRQYLRQRRIVTTRVEVVGPTYLEVHVRARVQAMSGASTDRVRQDILQALDRFLSPQAGDGDQPGWPFGRDVYRTEILQVIDGVAGVDYVNLLELIPGEGEAQCGNLRVCPTWLVVPGNHEIEVLRG